MKTDSGRLLHLTFTLRHNETLRVDLNDDGNSEAVAPLLKSSSAGCGCDKVGLVFLNETGQEQDPPADIRPQLKTLNDELECGEKLDLVAKNGQYFVVKRSKSLMRTIYPLTGKAHTPPSCMLVNSSPLTLKPQ
jgi:hypothetical protein